MNNSTKKNDGDFENHNLQKSKKEKELIVSVERNIEEFAKLGLFCTDASKSSAKETTRTIHLGEIVLENNKIVEKKITIIPSALYGYPTIGALELLEAFQYLHHKHKLNKQQENNNTIYLGSIRKFITEILGQKYTKKSRDAFYQHLAELHNTSFKFENCFYDKETDSVIQVIDNFHLVDRFQIKQKTQTREYTGEESFIVFNPVIFSNFILGHTKPFFLSQAFKIRSEIAKLLYRMLCFHFSYYEKAEYSTERIFEQLRLKGEDYIYPSARKRILERAIKELVDLPISLNKIVSEYRFEKTVDGSDWKLIVFCRKNPKIIDSTEQFQKLLPETQNNAHRETIEIEPIQEEGKDKKHCREQNNTDLGHISKNTKPSPQKANKISDIDSFIKLFAKSFPNAKPAEKVSLKVKQKVQAFLKIYPLEKAEAFLKFCLKLGQEEKYNAILLAQTVNYLIDYKIGDQLLVDAWLQKDVKPQNYNTLQQQKLAEGNFQKTEDNYHIWVDFTEKYKDEYNSYLMRAISSLSDEHLMKFEKYKQSYFLPINTKSDLVACFYYFCGSNSLSKLAPCFVEWANQFKTEEYKKVRHFRDTSKEERSISKLGWE